jgi:hypothetical protein
MQKKQQASPIQYPQIFFICPIGKGSFSNGMPLEILVGKYPCMFG